MRYRVWESSGDWTIVVQIADDGTETVIYEHHSPGQDFWLDFMHDEGIDIEKVNLDHEEVGFEWGSYDDIDPSIRERFNKSPHLSFRPSFKPKLEYEHAHNQMSCERVKLGIPAQLIHEHDFTDEHHDHDDMGYGPAFRKLGDC